MTETKTCVCCGKEHCFRWSDTHGVGVCDNCGLPYRILHYENNVRVEKPPEPAIDEAWIAICKRYWIETQRRVVPGAFDLGFLRRRGGLTYSGASESDVISFNNWCRKHKSELPAKATEGQQ